MRNLARTLAAIITVLFLVFGILYMLSPETRMAGVDLEASSNLGLATMRAFVGGGFLSFGILLAIHTVIAQETGALRFAILFLLLSIVGRVVSLIEDGTGNEAVNNLVPVTAMLLISIGSLTLFQRSTPLENE